MVAYFRVRWVTTPIGFPHTYSWIKYAIHAGFVPELESEYVTVPATSGGYGYPNGTEPRMRSASLVPMIQWPGYYDTTNFRTVETDGPRLSSIINKKNQPRGQPVKAPSR